MNAPKSPSASNPLWTFLNSSFGIFLLSSVVLGSLSFGYTAWRQSIDKRRQMEQLDLEIALRIQAMEKMCTSKENVRYSNLVNINKVMGGETEVSLNVRKPIFNEFEHKGLTTLMWQLYLLVDGGQKKEIKDAIHQANDITEKIRQVRLDAASALDDSHPQNETKAELDKRIDIEDHFTKDFGQQDVYNTIQALNNTPRWQTFSF